MPSSTWMVKFPAALSVFSARVVPEAAMFSRYTPLSPAIGSPCSMFVLGLKSNHFGKSAPLAKVTCSTTEWQISGMRENGVTTLVLHSSVWF